LDPIKGIYDLARAVRNLPPDVSIHVEFRGPVRDGAERAVFRELGTLVAGDPRVTSPLQ